MLTQKAEVEKTNLEKEIEQLKKQEKDFIERAANSEPSVRKVFRKEANRIWNLIYKKEEKVRKLLEEKISTVERNSLSKESFETTNFIMINHDKSLGMTNITKIGFSKTLNVYVKVELVRYSGFMANVKGCASLANKREMDSFTILSGDEYDKLKEKETSKNL